MVICHILVSSVILSFMSISCSDIIPFLIHIIIHCWVDIWVKVLMLLLLLLFFCLSNSSCIVTKLSGGDVPTLFREFSKPRLRC